MKLIPPFLERRIAHRPNLVKVVDNIGWLTLDKVLRMGVGLLVGVLVARYLGPEQFGQLSFAHALVGMFAAVAGLGLQSIVVRDIVRDPAGVPVTLGTAAVLQLAGGLLAYLLLLATIVYLRPDDALSRTIVAILGATLLLKAGEVAGYWFESQVQSKYTVWVQNGVFLVFAAVKVALILAQAPLVAFVWATLVEAAMVVCILVVVMNRMGQVASKMRVSIERAKTLVKDSWPLVLSGVAIMIYMKIDQIMLGEMVGDEAVGIYSAAVRLSEVWYFIPVAIASSLFPSLLETRRKNKALYHERLQRLYDLMVIISVAIALPMTVLAKPVVMVLYGSAYLGADVVFAIHIWTGVFVFLGVASAKWFLAEDHQVLALKRALLGAGVNVGLNFLLIPKFGATGAAIATLSSYAVADYLADMLQSETRSMFIMKTRSLSIISAFSRIIKYKE